MLTYNRPAIPPLGECKSNWEVMRLLATALGFDDAWLHQSPDEVIDEVLTATARRNEALRGITLEQLKANGAAPLKLANSVPYAGCRFPTPSGKVELYSQQLANQGVEPLPGSFAGQDDGGSFGTRATSLLLVSPASHHFVSSSLASQPGLLKNAGKPFLEIHPADAAARGIVAGDLVEVANGRGAFQVRAVVTEAVRSGVVASPKGRWGRLSGGRNTNWTTSDALADLAGQSTFHSNRVWVRRVGAAES
jgi:anaerobic selenocysteine-containing dehydrogenase